MTKGIICTVCPMGCQIVIEGTKDGVTSIEGFNCNRGKDFGIQEFLHPVRILTTTVKLVNGDKQIPVRSDKPIPKELLLDCMDIIRRTSVRGPVTTYDVLISNICGSNANIVATSSAD